MGSSGKVDYDNKSVAAGQEPVFFSPLTQLQEHNKLPNCGVALKGVKLSKLSEMYTAHRSDCSSSAVHIKK